MADVTQREQLSENIVAFLASREAEKAKNQAVASIKLDDLPLLEDLLKTSGIQILLRFDRIFSF